MSQPGGYTAHLDTFCRDNLPADADMPQFVFDIPDVRYPDRLNCASELVTRHVEAGNGDRPCVSSPCGERLTYAQADALSNQLANLLVSQYGVVPGNRLLLRSTNKPWLLVAWLAGLKAGAVVVTTVPLLRPRELDTIQSIAAATVAMCDSALLEGLRESTLADLPTLEVSGLESLRTLVADQPDSFEAVQTAGDDIAMLAFTSGTTGVPKGTLHYHRDVLAIADTFGKYVLQPVADDVFIGTPPLAFTFGLGGLVVFPMRVGASTVLVEKATPPELAELIERHGATVCFTAPTAYRAMLAAGLAPKLASLRRAVSAGEHLPQAVWEAFREQTGVRLIDGIGSTEMLHIFISSADDDIRPGSTGRAVPGFQAKIVDAAGEEVPRGTEGRLAVRGPVGCRYLADSRQSAYVQDGWNITGDTFMQDEDGYFWYRARNDDMIVSSGYNIAGPEVEEALIGHPAISEIAVVGTPDEDRGHVVHAFIVLAPGSEPTDELRAELQEFAKEQIAPYKYPRRITFLDELPKTNTGKLQRFRLRQDWEASA